MPSTPKETYFLPAWLRSWEEFWFKPADPTIWAVIRIACGLIVVYTLFVYSFKLQEFMGEHGWHDLSLRNDSVRNQPRTVAPLNWSRSGVLPSPRNDFELKYL